MSKASDSNIVIEEATSESPFSFVLGGGKVIKGFDIAVKNMRVGQKGSVLIRSDYAYGKIG